MSVVGIARFGLRDAIDADGFAFQGGWGPECVILPDHPLGRTLVGAEAREDRIHSGLAWPPEARIPGPGEGPLRRAPLAVLWRALVESGDDRALWKARRGADHVVGRLLGRSIRAFCAAAPSWRKRPQAVIAIPDSLDEAGQDALLQGCRESGRPEPWLIWRPVAAALAWLERMGPFLPPDIARQGADDHLLVLHLGGDALEIADLRLRRRIHKGDELLLPLRDRPARTPALSGLDWIAHLAEDLLQRAGAANDADAPAALWQAVAVLPDLWRRVAGAPPPKRDEPSLWMAGGGQPWPPEEIGLLSAGAASGRSSAMLRGILRDSRPLAEHEGNARVPESLAREIAGVLRGIPARGLRGVIVCGPLAPARIAGTWLEDVLKPLEGHLPASAVHLAPGDAILARGAAIYGVCRKSGIPAYLDTMPQVSLLTQTRGIMKWHPLLNAQEVVGGEEFTDTIPGRFSLPAGHRQVRFLLCRGPAPTSNAGRNPPDDGALPPCRARLLRFWVRNRLLDGGAGRQAVMKAAGNLKPEEGNYVRAWLEHAFPDPSADTAPPEPGTPFRSYDANFPVTPESDILLDVHVAMTPASGRARVTFQPQKPGFLDGRGIRLNYERMHPARPPRASRAWPDVEEIAAHPDDPALIRNTEAIAKLEDVVWPRPSLLNAATKKAEKAKKTKYAWLEPATTVRDRCLRAPYMLNDPILPPQGAGASRFSGLRLMPLTENGESCTKEGRALIRRLAGAFAEIFGRLMAKRDEAGLRLLLSRATWLWRATPPEIADFIRNGLVQGGATPAMNNAIVESASKCLADRAELRHFFDRIRLDAVLGGFNIFSMRSADRVLRFRAEAPHALDAAMALDLAERTADLLKSQAAMGNFKNIFFQGVRLMISLLRFRMVDPGFASPGTAEMPPFERVAELVDQAAASLAAGGDARKADRARAARADLEDFLHRRASGSHPLAVQDLAGD